ncbi:hypothetical protein WT72_16050 [Burkholderia pseudomultivorans]|nr:hypothetical protein WT72_16050 [Burkholderia pseudomultivorans]
MRERRADEASHRVAARDDPRERRRAARYAVRRASRNAPRIASSLPYDDVRGFTQVRAAQ